MLAADVIRGNGWAPAGGDPAGLTETTGGLTWDAVTGGRAAAAAEAHAPPVGWPGKEEAGPAPAGPGVPARTWAADAGMVPGCMTGLGGPAAGVGLGVDLDTVGSGLADLGGCWAASAGPPGGSTISTPMPAWAPSPVERTRGMARLEDRAECLAWRMPAAPGRTRAAAAVWRAISAGTRDRVDSYICHRDGRPARVPATLSLLSDLVSGACSPRPTR